MLINSISGCGYCKWDSIAIQEQYVCSVKEKSIATLNPDIAKEWHPLKNESLKPEFVRAGYFF